MSGTNKTSHHGRDYESIACARISLGLAWFQDDVSALEKLVLLIGTICRPATGGSHGEVAA
jgi:hypothetical protein